MSEDIKDRLKEFRNALGLKQREIAERIGVRTGDVGNWETGRHIPATRIYQICNEFHVRREWLESGDGEMFEPKTPEVNETSVKRDLFRRTLANMTVEELEALKSETIELLESKKEP